MDSIVYEDVKLGPFLIADVDGMVKNNIKDYSQASNLKLAEVSTSSSNSLVGINLAPGSKMKYHTSLSEV